MMMRSFLRTCLIAFAAIFLTCPADAGRNGRAVAQPMLGQFNGPPGVSQALFNNPVIYTCVTNYYVATTGSDSNNGTTPALAWLTIQHADTLTRSPGDCINVAPGNYNTGATSFVLTKGGNAPTQTGYVTYRCQTMNQCFMVYNGGLGGVAWGFSKPYFIVDGFDLDGGDLDVAGGVYGGNANGCFDSSIADTGTPGHHIWLFNNKVHGCNGSCIGLNDSEYYYAIHNEAYNCAFTNGFDISGIDYVFARSLNTPPNTYAPYTPSGQDFLFAPFNNVIGWNKVHDNGETTAHGSTSVLSTTCNVHTTTTMDGCASTTGVAQFQLVTGPNNLCVLPQTYVVSISSGSITLSRQTICTQTGIAVQFQTVMGGHTDGNGIILDNTQNYNGHMLVVFNDVQFSGGRGIHSFIGNTSGHTIAYNSMYHNGLDITVAGVGWGELSNNGASGNNWYGNIGFVVSNGVTTCGTPPCNVGIAAFDSGGQIDLNNVYQHNILSDGTTLNNNDVSYWAAGVNKSSTDPLYVNESSTVIGDLHLQAGSPALGYAYPPSGIPANHAGAYQ